MGATRRRVGRVIRAYARSQTRQEWRPEVQFAGIGKVVAELAEIADHRPRESERVDTGDAGGIRYRQAGVGVDAGNRVGVGAQTEIVAEILQAAAQLQLVFDAIRD